MSIYPYLEKITLEQAKYINEFNLDKNIQFIEVNCPTVAFPIILQNVV